MRRWLGDPVVVVGVSSALAGFVVGAAGFGTWQVAVESAQVVAGIVEYPRDNPFYMYHTKLWTLLHQLGALLLRAGLSEPTLSLLVSGLQGAVSFPALALTTLALCRDRLLAFGVPFFVELTRAANFEIAYPVWILGSTHTYGVIGLSLALLVAAVLGNGRLRAGAFGLGLLPAVHPSIGAWMWLVVGLAVVLDRRGQRETLKAAWRPFAAGALLAVLSLGIHLAFIADVPKADPEASSRYLAAFVRLWDAHRRPISLHNPGVYVAVGALVVCVFWLVWMRGGPRPEARLLLRLLAVSGMLGLGFLVLSWKPEKIPDVLLIAMPNRLVNLIVLAALPLLVGLLASRRDVLGHLNLAVLLVAGVYAAETVGVGYLRPNSNFPPGFHFVLWPPLVPVVALGVSALLLLLAVLARPGDEKSPGPTREKGKPTSFVVPLLRVAALAALTWAAVVAAVRTQAHWPMRDQVLRDFRRDPLLAEVSAQKGLLVTASDLHLIQLRTRRPVLIDGGGLDLLAYTLEAGPALDKILRRVYGIDLFAPPADAVAMGSIPLITTRMTWEGRGSEEWKAIGAEFGATGVLTYADWQLRLPLVARNDEFAFYRIDPAGGTR